MKVYEICENRFFTLLLGIGNIYTWQPVLMTLIASYKLGSKLNIYYYAIEYLQGLTSEYTPEFQETNLLIRITTNYTRRLISYTPLQARRYICSPNQVMYLAQSNWAKTEPWLRFPLLVAYIEHNLREIVLLSIFSLIKCLSTSTCLMDQIFDKQLLIGCTHDLNRIRSFNLGFVEHSFQPNSFIDAQS